MITANVRTDSHGYSVQGDNLFGGSYKAVYRGLGETRSKSLDIEPIKWETSTIGFLLGTDKYNRIAGHLIDKFGFHASKVCQFGLSRKRRVKMIEVVTEKGLLKIMENSKGAYDVKIKQRKNNAAEPCDGGL